MHRDEMVHIDEYLPFVEPEAPTVPVPILRRLIREALIESCEQAPIWRWHHPEVQTKAGNKIYDLVTPDAESLIHSVLSLKVNGRQLVNSGSPCIDGVGSGFQVFNRGQLDLDFDPKTSSAGDGATGGAAPTPPTDPGPVQTTFPLNMPELTPERFEIDRPRDTNFPWYYIGRVADPIDYTSVQNTIILAMDFSNTNPNGNESSSILLGVPTSPASSNGVYTVYKSSYYLNELSYVSSPTSTSLTQDDVDAAVADGKPWLILRWRMNSFWEVLTPWLASPDDADVYVSMDQMTNTATFPAYSVDAGSSVADIPVNDSTSGKFRLYPGFRLGFNLASSFEALYSSNLYYKLYNDPIGTLYLTPGPLLDNGGTVVDITYEQMIADQHYIELDDGSGNTREYDIVTYADPSRESEAHTNTTIDAKTWGGTALNNLFMLIKKPTDTERGILYFVDRTSTNQTQIFKWRLAPPILQNAVAGGTTQEDVDAYLAALAQYEIDLALYNATAQPAPEGVKGIELCITVKPTTRAMYAPKIIFDNHRDLIVKGTLYRLFAMNDIEWSDSSRSKRIEMEYDVALGKARAEHDRGYVTKSHRLSHRRF